MQNKTNQSTEAPQELIAGMDLRNANDIEFFGIKKNKTVQFLQGGRVHYFSELPMPMYFLLQDRFNRDKGAREYFESFDVPMVRKVEIYTYYMYGDLDHRPDIVNGQLRECENFRDSYECPSLSFDFKSVKLNGAVLNKRELGIIEMSALGWTDEAIAQELGIKLPTLDCHKKTLFNKTGTTCKLDLVSKSYKQRVIA